MCRESSAAVSSPLQLRITPQCIPHDIQHAVWQSDPNGGETLRRICTPRKAHCPPRSKRFERASRGRPPPICYAQGFIAVSSIINEEARHFASGKLGARRLREQVRGKKGGQTPLSSPSLLSHCSICILISFSALTRGIWGPQGASLLPSLFLQLPSLFVRVQMRALRRDSTLFPRLYIASRNSPVQPNPIQWLSPCASSLPPPLAWLPRPPWPRPTR